MRGKCFVVVSAPNGWRFYPSRFMGYVDNTMEKHTKMGKPSNVRTAKDGKKTNPAISHCLGELIEGGGNQWDGLEARYREFCIKLGITPIGNKRKFWKPISG